MGMITMIGEDDIQNILYSLACRRALTVCSAVGPIRSLRQLSTYSGILRPRSGLLTLEEAIRRMTSLPAEILHLSDRGTARQSCRYRRVQPPDHLRALQL